ncbi:unnamed protein product [Schistosoma intercalatum]|nr:unnamed protein product [Schistosoma intercalatum]
MINDYVHRSPLAPPIIIVWHFYEAYKAIGNQCASLRNAETAKYNPFCVRFTDVKKEREMVKWEHMKAMDYLREPSTKATGKRGVAESRAVVFRGGGGVGPGQGPVMDLKSEMSSVTENTNTLLLANEDSTAVNEDDRCDGHFVRIPLFHKHCTYLLSVHYNTLCMLCENTINITDIIP